MAKIIVTHFRPDLDALGAIWLIKRFFPEDWEEAELKFVPAGKTFRGAPADSDPEVVHVDTGLGKFDHHQGPEPTSSSAKILENLKKEKRVKKEKIKVLERLVKIITEVDNGRMITWQDASSDAWEFGLDKVLSGFSGKDEALVGFGLQALDGIFNVLKSKVAAEEILPKGEVFQTRWGKGIAVQTGNDEVLTLGQKKGFVMVAIQNPIDNRLRVYSRSDKEIDLTGVYEKLKKKDAQATWYLHPSKKLLLNGSRADPEMVPTKLSLSEIVKILKKA